MSPARQGLWVAFCVAVVVQAVGMIWCQLRAVQAVRVQNAKITPVYLLTHRWPLVRKEYRRLFPRGTILTQFYCITVLGAVVNAAFLFAALRTD